MFQTPEERQAVREEVRIMSKIFHPNVVLFMGACTLEGNNIMIGACSAASALCRAAVCSIAVVPTA